MLISHLTILLYIIIGLVLAVITHWQLTKTTLDLPHAHLHLYTLASIIFLPMFILYVLALVLIGLFYTDATTHLDTEPLQPEDWGC